MRIKAALYNADHLEYGLVTIPFPIPQDQYNDTIKMLEALDIGDPRAKDCMVEEIEGCVPSLKCLEGHRINVDELDYLVKRLDSFSDGELAQFQGMVVKMGLSDMTDLINLTFCCQQATVITDFSDLEQIGRDHYMNLHGGCASMEELERLDARKTALDLILNDTSGQITPYGVVYDNGTMLEQVYDGRHFPDFYYKNSMASVLLSLNNQMNEQETLYFPCAESEITRTLCRLGATQPEKFTATLIATDDDISPAVRSVFEGEYPLTEHLKTLNALSKCLQLFDAQTLDKFHTVFDTIWPDTPEEILWIAENIYDFRRDYGEDIAQSIFNHGERYLFYPSELRAVARLVASGSSMEQIMDCIETFGCVVTNAESAESQEILSRFQNGEREILALPLSTPLTETCGMEMG